MKSKSYIFNQENYSSLYDLSQAYIAHFDDAITDVTTNGKELIRFIKSRVNDKDNFKKYIEIFENTKYASNIVTFLIFEMSNQKEIYISGVKMDLLTFLQALRENPDPANNILFGFLEDGGITKTFAVAGADKKLCKHSRAIEKNFRNPFTYKYLVSYYDYETKESLEGKVRSIAITNEENFRRFSKLASTESFLLSLSHRAGFTDTIEAIRDTNPTFQALKLLNRCKEVEEELLRRILDDTFFFWMLSNFDKYDYKPKAAKIYRNYAEINKEYDSYMNQIKTKKISSISFDNYVDISKRLYDNYLYFISAYKNDLISVKKKYEIEKYDPNKAYCKTYITEDYMRGKVIKLYSADEKPDVKINPLTGEPIEEAKQDSLDDVSSDVPELILPEDKKFFIDVDNKKITQKKQYNFLVFTVILSILASFPLLVMVLFSKLFENGKLGQLGQNYGYFLASYGIYLVLGAYLLIVLFSLLALVFNKKSQYALKRYNHLVNDIEPEDFVEEERILYYEERTKEYKLASKTYQPLCFIILVLFSILVSYVAIFGYLSIAVFVPQIKVSNVIDKYYLPFILGAVIGFLYGLLFPKKTNLSLIIYSVIVFVVSIVILLFV